MLKLNLKNIEGDVTSGIYYQFTSPNSYDYVRIKIFDALIKTSMKHISASIQGQIQDEIKKLS